MQRNAPEERTPVAIPAADPTQSGHHQRKDPIMSDVITEYRIARALKSGPPAIREGAKVVEMGADGTLTVLREGTNG